VEELDQRIMPSTLVPGTITVADPTQLTPIPPTIINVGTPEPAPTGGGSAASMAGVTVSTNHLQMQVGGPDATYTIALTSQPSADVSMSIDQVFQEIGFTNSVPGSPIYAPTARVYATPETLAFTPDDWSTPQTVTVSAQAVQFTPAESTAALGDKIVSADPNYNGLTVAPVIVDVAAPGVVLSTQSLWVTRGGNSTDFTVALGTQPASAVTVTIAQSYGGDPLQITPATLTFTPDNWNTPQAVSIGPPTSGMGSDMDDLTLTDTSADPNYDNSGSLPPMIAFVETPPPPVHVHNPAGIVVSTQSLTVTTGGAGATYTVALASQPAADVTVTVSQQDAGRFASPSGASILVITPQTLVFTPDDWNQPQTVSVSAPGDWNDGGFTYAYLNNAVTSADPNYNNLAAPSLTVNLQSNPDYSLVFNTTGFSLAPGDGGCYSVALASQPAAEVTVTISTPNAMFTAAPAGPCQVTPDVAWIDSNTLSVTPRKLRFTPHNWNVAQIVNVTAAPSTGCYDEFSQILHTVASDDPNWNHIYVPPLNFNVIPPYPRTPITIDPPVTVTPINTAPIAIVAPLRGTDPGFGAGTGGSSPHHRTPITTGTVRSRASAGDKIAHTKHGTRSRATAGAGRGASDSGTNVAKLPDTSANGHTDVRHVHRHHR
jgi:hypothetical protein